MGLRINLILDKTHSIGGVSDLDTLISDVTIGFGGDCKEWLVSGDWLGRFALWLRFRG